ncbi:hypothetical protein BDV10DRAFT_30299 [Aspergillus recurvatus]
MEAVGAGAKTASPTYWRHSPESTVINIRGCPGIYKHSNGEPSSAPLNKRLSIKDRILDPAVQQQLARSALALRNGGPAGKPVPSLSDASLAALALKAIDMHFLVVLRRAFASRFMAPDVTRSSDIRHIKGVLIYGPPRVRKGLIARQVAMQLPNVCSTKAINGAEIKSDSQMRELFKQAGG